MSRPVSEWMGGSCSYGFVWRGGISPSLSPTSQSPTTHLSHPCHTGATRGNFNGPGLGNCRVADDCATLDREEQVAKAGAGGRGRRRRAQGMCVVCVCMFCFVLM